MQGGLSYMLTKKQKKALRSIGYSKCQWQVKEGKNNSSIPSFVQLKAEALKEIAKLGFVNVEIVNPKKANSLLRLYQTSYDYERDEYNVYGTQFFTKSFGKWISKNSMSSQLKLDYEKCIIRKWLCQDDYIDLNCEFFDIYLKIR